MIQTIIITSLLISIFTIIFYSLLSKYVFKESCLLKEFLFMSFMLLIPILNIIILILTIIELFKTFNPFEKILNKKLW